MGLHHRKLMQFIPEICQIICHVKDSESCSSDCTVCLRICLPNPPETPYTYYSPPTPPPTPEVSPFFSADDGDQGTNHHISTYLILTLALLTVVFFLVCCRAIFTRFYLRRSGASRRQQQQQQQQQQTQQNHDDFLDEEHGPVVDHPIWYIRNPGLQQSIINAITVCKYKKGEGLIEGTECAVCLGEFQEDENLRLLPKCHHAFHLPCIDTWLGSHTNCPLCRAPIVANPAITSLESNVVDSSSLENTHMEILENSGETNGGLEDSASDSGLRNSGEEEGQLEVQDGKRVCETESPVVEVATVLPRRSVSLDSSSVANINLALAKALSLESKLGNSNTELGGVSKGCNGNDLPTTSKGSSSFRLTRYLQGVPSPMIRSQSYNGKYLLSWYGRSQRKPNAPLRSV